MPSLSPHCRHCLRFTLICRLFMLVYFLLNTLPMISKRKKRTSSARNSRIARIFGDPDPWRPAFNLGPLNLVQTLSGDEFVDLLSEHEDQADAFLRKNLPDFAPQLSVGEILRVWVDEWLDSGKSEDGADDPRKRNFEKADGASLAAYKYSKGRRISLLGRSGDLGIWFDPYKEDPKSLSPYFGPTSEDIAREKLVFFLLSDLRYKLAKCRKAECGRYFLLKHWKRSYRRGTVCDTCQRVRSLESAVKATANNRLMAKKVLYKLVTNKFASQILNTPDWYRNAELKEAIVNYLNTCIKRSDSLRALYWSGPRKGVTGKWLANSKNWKEIETATKGGD